MKSEPNIKTLMYVITAAHILTWVVLPSLFEGSLRIDAAEGMTGGPEWQLSYAKHPPLSEWLTSLAWYTGPVRYSALYLISQLFAAGSVFLISRWVLSVFGAVPGLVALCAGLASPFATYTPIQFNHNIAVMPFWALAIITSWSAFNTNKIISWFLFGLVVGFGAWAKYSIFQIVLPIGIVFFAIPEWRRHIFSVGPWVAVLTTLAIIAPHVFDVFSKSASTIRYAINSTYLLPREVAGFSFNMFLNCSILTLFIAIPFVICSGGRAFLKVFRGAFNPSTKSARDLFLTVVTFGPMVVLMASPVFGVRPRPLWITPLFIPLIVWFANLLSKIESVKSHRALIAAGISAAMLVTGYLSTILIPIQNDKPQYSNIDHRRLVKGAQEYWRLNGTGRIFYIVQTERQAAMHAAGSIAFDLPYRVHVFEQAKTKLSPWIRPNDVTRRGVLVIGSPDIPEDFRVNGMPVVKKSTYQLPTVRGRSRAPITFGVVEAQVFNDK